MNLTTYWLRTLENTLNTVQMLGGLVLVTPSIMRNVPHASKHSATCRSLSYYNPRASRLSALIFHKIV